LIQVIAVLSVTAFVVAGLSEGCDDGLAGVLEVPGSKLVLDVYSPE
jgi:hypothetical protein